MKEPNLIIENLKAILEECTASEDAVSYVNSEDAGTLKAAIEALEKQEQTIDKSCETCKHKGRLVSEWRCCECFRASNLEDYWEPYTEEEA